ncbi:DUF6479 family protein [Streptomyces sp. NPDC000410]|uniref:DUF6479 family protein n=1 Tax=Streptomyces sp. NPDC000410 TaxID=3154254 RepID=UPI003329ADF6
MNSLNPLSSSAVTDVAAAPHLAGIFPFIIGVILIALLAGAMWYEGRRRARLRVPSPEEQPKRPDHQTHIEEVREADENDFPTGGERLLPYNLKTHSTHGAPAAAPEQPPQAPSQGQPQGPASGPGEGGAGAAPRS